MRRCKSIITFFSAVFLAWSISVLSITPVYAHMSILDVSYDDCVYSVYEDGVDEMWYVLSNNSSCWHLADDVTTIKYYFEDESEDGYTWDDYATTEEVEVIKNAYSSSMKKWNNVYYYSHGSNGVIEKHKIINIVEGTEFDHNLSIFPGYTTSSTVASTAPIEEGKEILQIIDGVTHKHYTEWKMIVYVNRFFANGAYPEVYVRVNRERTGAHEIGHILGLRDIDTDYLCGSSSNEEHHYELLMGYGSSVSSRSKNITYKDIVGVAITRGFHTDADHKWLFQGTVDGKYKMICSICNGVKLLDSMDGYINGVDYHIYGMCLNNHTLSSGYMMAVASYGNKDYYKCRFCRYVADYSLLQMQDYSKSFYSNSHHVCVNEVAGLEYSFYEEHNMDGHECMDCGASIHSYTDRYWWLTDGQHKAFCECGVETITAHVVAQGAFITPDGYGICMLCRGRVFMGTLLSIPANGLPYTANGSYILANGTIVLVEEDIEAYMDGSLVFCSGETE